MKIINTKTQSKYAEVLESADVTISVREARFLYHAFIELRKQMAIAATAAFTSADTKTNEAINASSQILHNMDSLMMPIVSHILIPVEADDFVYSFNSDANPTQEILEARLDSIKVNHHKLTKDS